MVSIRREIFLEDVAAFRKFEEAAKAAGMTDGDP
jgi:hypothetical protein